MYRVGSSFKLSCGMATIKQVLAHKNEYEVVVNGKPYARFTGNFLKRLEKLK